MNEELLERVLQSPRLPSLPVIAIEVIDLVQQEDVSIKQIASTIQNDAALSGKILRTVNSSFYGQVNQISTISQSLVVLGLNAVKTLALGFSLVANLKDEGGKGFNHFTFWKRSLYTAVAARELAQATGGQNPEEEFLAGLLADVGLLAMYQTLGSEYQELVKKVGKEHGLLRDLERKQLGTDHAEMGGALGEHWRLPPHLRVPIRFHETPDECPSDHLSRVRCLTLGCRVADVFISENPGEALETYFKQAEAWFRFLKKKSEPLLKQIHNNTIEMRRLFDLPTGQLGNAEEILARANEAMVSISLATAKQNEALTQQATTDSLTGVANRRKLNEYIAEQFAQAEKTGKPLSVVFLDTDHFKKFNDTYGHQVGDRVLVEQAKTIVSAAPAVGLVARYGGEEFAIVLPNTGKVEATRLAERVRQLIGAARVESDEGEQLSITASIGVATFSGSCFQSFQSLMKAADQAVYAAKHAGRNCVRIFSSRKHAA